MDDYGKHQCRVDDVHCLKQYLKDSMHAKEWANNLFASIYLHTWIELRKQKKL